MIITNRQIAVIKNIRSYFVWFFGKSQLFGSKREVQVIKITESILFSWHVIWFNSGV